MAAVVHRIRTTADANALAKPTCCANVTHKESFDRADVSLHMQIDALVTSDRARNSQIINVAQRDAAVPLVLPQRSTQAKASPSVPITDSVTKATMVDVKQRAIATHGEQTGCYSLRKGKDAFCSAFLSALKQPTTSPPRLSGNVCGVCQRQFSSRNKLFGHLRSNNHGQNWTPTALLVELQALVYLLQNQTSKSQDRPQEHRAKLCYVFWCLQKIVSTVPHLQSQEAHRMARTRAQNGATILHFVVDLWAICTKVFYSKICSEAGPKVVCSKVNSNVQKPFSTLLPAVIQNLKRIISWAIRNSKLSPKLPISHSKLPASSKMSWSGPWCTKHSATARGKYCGFKSAQQILQRESDRAANAKPLVNFTINMDIIWTRHDCKPGETALQVCAGSASVFLNSLF